MKPFHLFINVNEDFNTFFVQLYYDQFYALPHAQCFVFLRLDGDFVGGHLRGNAFVQTCLATKFL